jgi:hypothetical protein
VISVSALARGIAEADSVGIAANAQAATPISNNRFIWEFLLGAALSRRGDNVQGTQEFHFQIRLPQIIAVAMIKRDHLG